MIADDGTPSIVLLDKCTNLVISAGGFLLLERTSDDSVPGISADCIYVGALGNTGEFLKLKDGLINIIDSVDIVDNSWPAGNNDTKETMQRSGSNWITAVATPKSQNPISPPPPPADDSSSSNPSSSGSSSSSGGSASESKIKIAEAPQIKTQITGKTLGFVNLPLSLDAITLGLSGEQLRYGKYFWNFGDGDSREINLADSQPFSHTYFYPGDYIVSLDYFSNPYIYKDIPDSSSQITIKIIPADISISKVGDEKDFFIELTNNTNYSADISNWILASDTKNFTIPRNTILASKKKLIISPKITNFSITDKNTLKLMNSEKGMVFSFSQEPFSQEPFLRKVVKENTQARLLNGQGPSLNSEIEIPPDNLSASAISSDVIKNNSNNSYLPVLMSIVFIGASAGAAYFIRRKKLFPKLEVILKF